MNLELLLSSLKYRLGEDMQEPIISRIEGESANYGRKRCQCISRRTEVTLFIAIYSTKNALGDVLCVQCDCCCGAVHGADKLQLWSPTHPQKRPNAKPHSPGHQQFWTAPGKHEGCSCCNEDGKKMFEKLTATGIVSAGSRMPAR